MPLEYFSDDSTEDVADENFAMHLKSLDRGQVFAFANVSVDTSPSRCSAARCALLHANT